MTPAEMTPAGWIGPDRQLPPAPREHWAVINRFRNYEVSNLGRVRNRRTGRELTPYLNSHEPGARYYRVTLYRGAYRIRRGRRRRVRVSRKFYVHRLVALYHVPGRCRWRWQVDHRNAVPAWNWAINLRWCSPQQNLAWRWTPLNGQRDVPTRRLAAELAPF